MDDFTFTKRNTRVLRGIAATIALLATLLTVSGAEQKFLRGHVPAEVGSYHLTPVGRLPASQHLRLLLGLPLRNQPGLAQLIQQIYSPGNPNFHQYLNPAQFTGKFGPVPQDYQSVLDFAAAHGLNITLTHEDRVFVEVEAPVSTIENTFHVTLRTYQHPTETRQFFAPDNEPSIDADVPLAYITGLTDFSKPHPLLRPVSTTNAVPAGGSVNGSSYFGQDFRHAYAPDISLTGAGQMAGLVEFQGYYLSDITNYERQTTFSPAPNVPIHPITFPGYIDAGNDGDTECPLDIEMLIAMAPGLAGISVFEGVTWDQIFQGMATNTQIGVFACSWSGASSDPTAENYLLQMASQGQSFFQASGDGDAWVTSIEWPCDDPNATVVGATTLSMNGTGASYASESVWNVGYNPPGWSGTDNGYWGSGGGISANYPIPWWQAPVNMSWNNGSTKMRNIPDVTMVGNYVWVLYGGGLSGAFAGTSCAAPLWAGYAALVNQMATSNGLRRVGLFNPSLYAVGLGQAYGACFHDTTNGSNVGPGSTNQYVAVRGYDLASGWGSPVGLQLAYALLSYGTTWVDFNSGQNPPAGVGTFSNPFLTLAQAALAAPTNGNIYVRTMGRSPETLTLSKRVTIRAYNGSAVIGP